MFFALLLAMFAEGYYDYTKCTLVAARPRLLPWRRVSQEMPVPPVVEHRDRQIARVEPTPREKPSPETPDVAPQPEPPTDATAEAESERHPWRPFRPHGPDPPEPVPRPDGRLIDRVIHTGGSLLSFGSGLLTLAVLTPKLILAAEVLGLLLFVAVIYRVVRK
jgi:hypothetical protein